VPLPRLHIILFCPRVTRFHESLKNGFRYSDSEESLPKIPPMRLKCHNWIYYQKIIITKMKNGKGMAKNSGRCDFGLFNFRLLKV
jgi:hypothetical protein